MARRAGSLAAIPKRSIDASAARLAIAKHLTSLTQLHNVNMVQFRAQVHEEEMVETLVKFVRDESLPPALRKQAALDVITLARGSVKVWAHAGNTINKDEPGEIEGTTVGDELQAARNTTELYERFDKLVAAGVHPDDWPADVRRIAGDLIDHYTQVGTIIDQ